MKTDILDVTHKIIVVTGGAKGIGLAITKAFLSQGAQVIMLGRDVKVGKEVASTKETCHFYECDVTNSEMVKECSDQIVSKFGRIDTLILNAGTEAVSSSIVDTEIAHWHNIMDTNVHGVFYILKYFLPVMIEKQQGSVIFISSTASITGSGTAIPYPTSKAALKGMMARVNYDLLQHGVRANMISPGLVDTAMLRKKYPNTDEINANLTSQVPMGRIGRPEEIAHIALFLASGMSSYVCGQDIVADGGRLQYRRSVVKPH